MQVLLYGIIPLKVKWMGYLEGILVLIQLIRGGWAIRVVIICSLLNFIVFFLLIRKHETVSGRRRSAESRSSRRRSIKAR